MGDVNDVNMVDNTSLDGGGLKRLDPADERRLVRVDEGPMTLNRLAEKVADEIPKMWDIMIEMSRGYASLVLVDPDGNDCEFHLDDGIEAAVLAALEHAKANRDDS